MLKKKKVKVSTALKKTKVHTTSALMLYCRDIDRIPLLTKQQEAELGALALAGDEVAQDKMVQANLRFVVRIAKKYERPSLDIMDLIQAGNLGLQHAAKKFDPTRGVRFVSYAVHWITQMIQKEVDGSNGTVRATQTQSGRNRRVRRMQEESMQKDGRELSMDELAEKTGYTKARIVEAIGYRATILSLDEPSDPGDDRSATLGQIIGTDEEADERESNAEREEVVRRVLDTVLRPREAEVLREYLGFDGRREQSLTNIGRSRGITRERARQLKQKALKKLADARDLHPLLRSVFETTAEVDAKREGRKPELLVIEQPSLERKRKPLPGRTRDEMFSDVD